MEISRGVKRGAMGVLAAFLILASSIFTYAEDGTDSKTTQIEEKTDESKTIQLSIEDAIEEAIKNSDAVEISNLELETKKIELKEAKNNEKNYRDSDYSPGTVQGIQLGSKFFSTAADYALEEEAIKQKKTVEDIKYNATNAYYGVLNAKSALDAAIDNLDNSKRSHEIVSKKYELGVVSKSDLLIAQYSLDEAVASMENAQNSYKNATMALDMIIGRPLDTELELTSTYAKEGFSADIKTDIQTAYDSRLDVKQMQHGYELAKLDFETNSVKYTSNTFVYKKKELAAKKAEQSLDDLKLNVEFDIKQKYNGITTKKRNMEIKNAALEKAKEALRLTELSYDAGYKTILDVREARNILYYAQLGYDSEVSQYNLSIIDYNKAVNIGGN